MVSKASYRAFENLSEIVANMFLTVKLRKWYGAAPTTAAAFSSRSTERKVKLVFLCLIQLTTCLSTGGTANQALKS